MRRRDFLKASAVGASLPILDGCRGPEEAFIVQRVRQTNALPGESVWQTGVCRQCEAGCGIQIRTVDGDAKKIEGLEAHPVNRGGVCALGHSVLQELYNPDRLLQAQRATGERGSGQFEAMAWDDALSAVIGAISATPADRIAIVGAGRAGPHGALWRRFADALGAAPPAFLEPLELEVERRAAAIALGIEEVPYFDIERAEYVLSIGAPVLDRWHSPTHYTRAFAEMRRGRATRRGWFVQAESRMSLTAANADEWLPIRPGTEGVLARALGGHILAEGGVGAVAAQRYRVLFPGAAPSLEDAALACDVPVDRILSVAEELASHENALVIGGGSAGAHTNGVANVVAALGLNLLLDNLGQPGGVFAPARLGLVQGIAPAGAPMDETPLAELAARLRGEGDPVDLLLVAGGDLVHVAPGGWGVAEAIGNVGTVVVLSSFFDDTALHADLVLPVATELETFDAVAPAASVGVPVLSVAAAAVEPMGDGQHPADVLLQITAGLGEPMSSRFPWSDFEELVEERVGAELASLPGSDGMTASQYMNAAVERGGIFGESPPSETPPGPAASAPAMGTPTFTGAEDEYGFVLLPFESLKVGNGRGANRPWLQEQPDPMSTVMWNAWVELSPDDAAALDVDDGDLVALESPAGRVEVHAVVDPAVRPGTLSMPMGHGHQAYGRYAEGRGANVMELVAATPVEGTSAPAWASTRVRITRLGPGQLVRFGRSYEAGGAHEVIPVGWAPHDTTRPGHPPEVVRDRGASV
ncbi:MAG TPA: molybdopterin dinucleotide binding domain-containing protein [Longimicrobiales bacterium]|nr:molybdopterin dinucleotide binding domain-containing protein [Longimicrobiales bacterium]